MFSARRVSIIAALLAFAPAEAFAGDHGFVATVWHAFLLKLEHMQSLDEHNAHLRKRAAELEIANARLQDQYAECRENKRAEVAKREAKREGGAEHSRTIASLSTADEALLSQPPKAIFEKALQSFNSHDFETSAKALSFLATHPENDSFKTAETFYLAGVSLFKVANYKKALWHFEQARKHAEGSAISYAPRALGWIALCHAKLGDNAAEKAAVRELIQKYPKSKEARRLNRHA